LASERDVLGEKETNMNRLWIMPTIALILLISNASAGNYERIIVFGESVSDAGNQWIVTEKIYPPSPPYFQGRWSNGPIWVDLVSARLGQGYTEPSRDGGTNFAWGGARSGPGEVIVNCADLGLQMCFPLASPNYGTQIDDFMSSNPVIDADDLFVIWGGHNDMTTEVDPEVAADNMTQHVTTLLDHGATDIVFLNLFNGVGLAEQLNPLLTAKMETVRQQRPEATIVEVDIPTMINEFSSNPGKWGITDFSTPALNTATLEVVDNPDAYLSWDGIHLTFAFNKVIADYVLRTMDPVLIRQGDFDADDALTTDDIDALTAAAAAPEPDLQYDLNFDGAINSDDHRRWVKDFRKTYFGDANLDGEFNSTDLVDVLAAGTYETDADAGWSTGDFNGSGRFDSADLIDALADGGYEQGPLASAATVPEPSGTVLVTLAFVASLSTLRQRLPRCLRADSVTSIYRMAVRFE
jgi:phospholipase/lecithinase/hemolysin